MAPSSSYSHFDARCALVTSPWFTPTVLAALRLLIGLYVMATLLTVLIWDGVRVHPPIAKSFFCYFTELTNIGLCSFYWAAGVQTLAYARRARDPSSKPSYPLQRWPRFLQLLHLLLHATIITFPFLVTIVYWALLASSKTFQTTFSTWSNISMHALNSCYALFEIFLTNCPPPQWIIIIPLVVILGCYLGVAYITHATQHFYTYSFLDPAHGHAKLAGYIIGITVAEVVIFCIVRGFIWLRQRATRQPVTAYSPTSEKEESAPAA